MEVGNEAIDAASGVAGQRAELVGHVNQFCRGEGLHDVPTRTPQSHEEVDPGQFGNMTFLVVLATSLKPACRPYWVQIIVEQILWQHSFFVVHKTKGLRNTVVFQCDNPPVGQISKHDKELNKTVMLMQNINKMVGLVSS